MNVKADMFIMTVPLFKGQLERFHAPLDLTNAELMQRRVEVDLAFYGRYSESRTEHLRAARADLQGSSFASG